MKFLNGHGSRFSCSLGRILDRDQLHRIALCGHVSAPHRVIPQTLNKSPNVDLAFRSQLERTISEHAQAGPTFVLLDEVETLIVARSKLSFEANPVDVHRATDAACAGQSKHRPGR